jgi:hypothetical protein
VLALAAPAAAQSGARPASTIEIEAGYAGFVDDSTIDHGVIGVSGRYYLTPRVAIGPEFVYMRGPDFDRDLFLTGNVTFDVLRPARGRPARVTPYFVAGAGLFHHRDRFGNRTFGSSEGAFTGGGGVRAWVSDRVYAGAELRLGWEPHYRVTGHLGFALGDR